MIAGWLDGIEPGKGAPAAAADTIKCLSVCEPWAWAIIHGPKGIENRSWATAYRGPLLIHASKSKAYLADPDELVASSRTVDEVRELEVRGEPVVIVDARSDRTREGDPLQARGSVRLPPDDAVRSARAIGLAQHATLVVYCA